MWKPPADQVETVQDNGWKPPSDAVVSDSPQTAPMQKPSILDTMGALDALSPANLIRGATLDPLGEKTTEGIGYLGAPKTGAAIGTAIQIAPEILSAYTGLKGLYSSDNPIVKGLINTPQELGPQYAEQNKAIDVVRRVPKEGGRLPQYPQQELQGLSTKPPKPLVPAEALPNIVPERLPGKPGDFMSYANQKLATHGDSLNPQELMDWQVKLQTDMSNGTIPKIDTQTGRITTIYQQASDLLSRIKGTFNPIAEQRLQIANLPEGTMPTRAGLDKAYGIAATLKDVTSKGLKWGVGGVASIAGAEYLRRKLLQ